MIRSEWESALYDMYLLEEFENKQRKRKRMKTTHISGDNYCYHSDAQLLNILVDIFLRKWGHAIHLVL